MITLAGTCIHHQPCRSSARSTCCCHCFSVSVPSISRRNVRPSSGGCARSGLRFAGTFRLGEQAQLLGVLLGQQPLVERLAVDQLDVGDALDTGHMGDAPKDRRAGGLSGLVRQVLQVAVELHEQVTTHSAGCSSSSRRRPAAAFLRSGFTYGFWRSTRSFWVPFWSEYHSRSATHMRFMSVSSQPSSFISRTSSSVRRCPIRAFATSRAGAILLDFGLSYVASPVNCHNSNGSPVLLSSTATPSSRPYTSHLKTSIIASLRLSR